MRRSYGFTLIELLVAISIIGVLAGMLLAGISRARYSAELARCKNNQRQIGQALHLYALANDGLVAAGLPYPTNQICAGETSSPVGLGLLYPKYLPNAACFFCPTDQLNDPKAEIAKLEACQDAEPGGPAGEDGYCSYIFRQQSVGEGSWKLFDPGINPEGKPIRTMVLEVNVPAYGHIVHEGDRVTVLFCDGSVRALNNDENVWTLDGADLMGETVRVFIEADARY